jgi:hypothetical protein
MLREDEIAVCVSGLAREGYETALKNIHKVFPYDTFYMHWAGYNKPNVPNCLFVEEPTIDYHSVQETKIKPDCSIWRSINRLPAHPNDRGGKLWWKPNYYENTRGVVKQLLAHYYLINTLPEKYKTIIRIRYDLIVSTKVDFKPLLELAQNGTTVGFAQDHPNIYGPEPFLRIHKPFDCKRCTGWHLLDHMYFHTRSKFANVQKLYDEKNLLGAEWGLYQILCHQWGNSEYINVDGGTCLIRYSTAPKETWVNL